MREKQMKKIILMITIAIILSSCDLPFIPFI